MSRRDGVTEEWLRLERREDCVSPGLNPRSLFPMTTVGR